jgi:hypothetical protein
MLGQHTIDVLTERLHLDEAAVRRMADEGVVNIWPET